MQIVIDKNYYNAQYAHDVCTPWAVVSVHVVCTCIYSECLKAIVMSIIRD